RSRRGAGAAGVGVRVCVAGVADANRDVACAEAVEAAVGAFWAKSNTLDLTCPTLLEPFGGRSDGERLVLGAVGSAAGLTAARKDGGCVVVGLKLGRLDVVCVGLSGVVVDAKLGSERAKCTF